MFDIQFVIFFMDVRSLSKFIPSKYLSGGISHCVNAFFTLFIGEKQENKNEENTPV